MKIGLDQYSIHHLPSLKGIQILDLVRSYGLEGIQYADIREISPKLDRANLREVHDHAKRHALYLEVGIPCINPHRPGKTLSQDGDGDLATGIRRHLELIAEVSIGSRSVRVFIGGPGDRLRGRVPWQQQIADTIEVARSAAPVLRDLKLKLAFENHADIATYEAVDIVEKLGADVAGICFDTGNIPITIEDPVAAAHRVAPYAIATHLKDGIVVFSDDGLALNPRPLGQGMLPLAEILQALHAHNPDIALSIEDHGNLYAIPIFAGDYLSSFTRLSPIELAYLVRIARNCERSIAEGALLSPAAVERTPWSARAGGRLESGARFAKAVADQLGLRRA